jgi:hypothetical protein
MKPLTKCSNVFCEKSDYCRRLIAIPSEIKDAMYFEALGDNPCQCRYFKDKSEEESDDK